MRSYLLIDQGLPEANLWERFVNHLWDLIRDTQMWTAASMVLLKIILIIIVSRLALMAVNRFIDHVTSEKRSSRLKLRTRRIQTVGRLLKNTASYTLNFIAGLLILGEFHIQITPLLAGAGVLGLAIGFGAQSLVKDVITGFFIILEDQFAVGDTIKTGEFKGTVEMIGLRATRLQSQTGEIHIIPNGLINQVTNFSVNPLTVIVDIVITSDSTVDELMEEIRMVLTRMSDPNLIEPPELLGIQTLAMNQVTLRVTAQCKPNTTDKVTRIINTELKKAFENRRMNVSS
ncbi:mechanosensitive ion channel family protein [Cohnella sp.]|uniref:mechanosensitive ion channel family protein n=1 Tax=Cohnella sp. TaxID=1883426 RepID=UPI00356737EF